MYRLAPVEYYDDDDREAVMASLKAVQFSITAAIMKIGTPRYELTHLVHDCLKAIDKGRDNLNASQVYLSWRGNIRKHHDDLDEIPF